MDKSNCRNFISPEEININFWGEGDNHSGERQQCFESIISNLQTADAFNLKDSLLTFPRALCGLFKYLEYMGGLFELKCVSDLIEILWRYDGGVNRHKNGEVD